MCNPRCAPRRKCPSCTKARDRQRDAKRTLYAERRAWAIAFLGGVCSVPDCENTDLEIDHIEPHEKEFYVGRSWSLSFDRFRAEIEKCQLLCNAHHRHKHYGRDDPEFSYAV